MLITYCDINTVKPHKGNASNLYISRDKSSLSDAEISLSDAANVKYLIINGLSEIGMRFEPKF